MYQVYWLLNGHYLDPQKHIDFITKNGSDLCKKRPPRAIIKVYVKTVHEQEQLDIECLTKQCLLSLEDTSLCAEHEFEKVEKSRAAKKRRDENKKKNRCRKEDIYCICRGSDDGSLLIQCDGCEEWFHCSCIAVTEENVGQMEE